MFHRSKNDRESYGIVGLGRFGTALATQLAQSGCELLVLDQDEEKIREMRELTDNAFVVSNLEKKTLQDTGIQNCDVAVVCIGSHIDTSILTTLNLVSMGIPTVIAKATSADHGAILEKLGAQVVYPERDMAVRLANRLENARMLDFVQLSEKINVTKMRVPAQLVGKTVAQADLRARFGLNIMALERQGSVVETVHPDQELQKEDILYLSGSRAGITRLNDWAAE